MLANAVIGNSIIDLEASSRCLLVNCCKSSTKHDTHLLSYLSENIESSTLEVFFLEGNMKPRLFTKLACHMLNKGKSKNFKFTADSVQIKFNEAFCKVFVIIEFIDRCNDINVTYFQMQQQQLCFSWKNLFFCKMLISCFWSHISLFFVLLFQIELLSEEEELKSLAKNDTAQSIVPLFCVQVTSNSKTWVVRRSYENFEFLDRQAHKCVFDRKYSQLAVIPQEENILPNNGQSHKVSKPHEFYAFPDL